MEAQQIAVYAVIVCIVISTIYFEVVRYQEGRAELSFKRWDLQTCTASDYSVRLNLPAEWHAKFLKKQKRREKNGKPKVDIIKFLRK